MSKTRKYVFTPARRAALRKATEASARSRKGKSKPRQHAESVANAFLAGGHAAAGHKAGGIAVASARRQVKKAAKKHIPASLTAGRTPRPGGRGKGLSGLKRNTIPYARVNKRGSTVGVNAGTIIPGTRKRIVLGGYGRIETMNKHTAVDKAIAGRKASLIPKGSKRAKVAGRAHSFLSSHGVLKNPALRVNIAGSQARLGTSRMGGPTVILRRGRHRTRQSKSRAGVQKYNNRMATIAGHKAKTKVARPQRRKAAKKRKRK